MQWLFLSYREETLCTTDIQNIQYADDRTVVTESARDLLQSNVKLWTEHANDGSMTINAAKAKIMNVGGGDENHAAITMREDSLEAVESRN